MNVYEIFTKITMQNGVSSVLAAISKEVLNLEGGIVKLAKAFEGLNRTSLVVGGGLAVLGGTSILYGLKKVTDQAKELSHELVQIQKSGISPAQFEQAKAAAFAMHAQVPGATSVDALRIYGQIYSPLGQANAIKMMQPLLEFAQVLGNTTGDYKGASDKVYEMVRAGDLMGKFMNSITHKVDITSLQRFLDLGGRVIQATHGKVTADTWFQMAQQGGPALSGMTDEGLLTMGIVAQMMKGPRAGTALMSLFQQMRGGIMTQWRAQELQKLGLVGGFHVQKGGHLTWNEGALETPFTRAFTKNPADAVQILIDAMAAHGITKQDDQVTKLYQLFQRQTSIREIHDLLRNLPQIQQETRRVAGGLGISSAFNLQNAQDYEQVMHNLDAAWQEMMMHVGGPLTIAAIPIMNKISSIFDKMGEFAKANPEGITVIGKALAALGVFFVTIGGAGIIGALISLGGPVGIFAALGVGIAYLVAANWNSLNKYVHQFSDAIRTFGVDAFEKVVEWTKKFGKAITELWGWMQSLNPFHHTSFEDNWFDGGGRIIRTSFGGGGGSFGGGVGGGGHPALSGVGGGGSIGSADPSIYGAIIRAEGTDRGGRNPYDTVLGYGAYGSPSKPLSTMTLDEAYAFGRSVLHRHGSSSAIGAFQIVGRTMKAAMAGLGLKGSELFSPANQRRMADWILHHQGLGAWEGFKSHPRDLAAARAAIGSGRGGHVLERIGGVIPGQGDPHKPGFDWHSVPFHHRKDDTPPAPIHNTMYLDGDVLHHSVVKRMVRGMTHPTTAPYHDGSRHWTPPDAGLVGV